jgi:hypothetical protein
MRAMIRRLAAAATAMAFALLLASGVRAQSLTPPTDPSHPTSIPAPTLREPDPQLRLAPIPVPPPAREPIDKRPFLLVGGAMVLVAIMLWNRARERKLEAEHGPTSPRQRRWRVKPGEPRDADGDADARADADELADAAHRPDDHEEGKS